MGGNGAASGFPSNAPIVPAGPQSAAETKDLHELAQYMRNVGQYGIYLNEQSLSGATFENVRGAAAAVERIITEFPQAAANFHELRGDTLEHGVLACASFSGVIRLGSYYYAKSENDLSYTYGKSVNGGFHPEGTGKDSIAAHEAGHILERAMIDKYVLSQGNGISTRLQASNDWNRGTYASKIISEACRDAKKTPAGKGLKNTDLIRSISGYATKNRSETLAECVADYTANGTKAKPLSVAVWNILKRELG